MTGNNNTNRHHHISTLSFLLVASLFFCWGVANNMNDTLLAAFKRIMSMSDLQTSLVQFAFYGAYFCMSLPAAFFIRHYSYKAGILLGIALYALGTMLFYPAGSAASYAFFLFAIYVMACGCAVLETTANPYILSMGAPSGATRRLNLAQTLNPLGAICGILLSRHFILSELNAADAAERANMSAEVLDEIQHNELYAVSTTYMLIGCALTVLFFIMLFVLKGKRGNTHEEATGMPESTKTSGSIFRRLWNIRPYRYGVIAQFFYVGVQTGVWSFTIRLCMVQLGVLESAASMIFLYSIIAFTAFRFLFTWIMKYFRPSLLLEIASVAALAFTCMVIFSHGWTAICALVAISACMSLMFPTIYGIALEGITGEDTKLAASGLIMAILGGALITPVQALVSDLTDISMSFVIPAVCFAVILMYSCHIEKTRKRNLSISEPINQ